MGRWCLLVSVVVTGALTGCQAIPATLIEPTSHPSDSSSEPAPADLSSLDTAPSLPSRRSIEPYAKDLLARYLAVTDVITSRGGTNPVEIGGIVTSEWLAEEQRGFAEFERQGIRTLGTTASSEVLVQSVRQGADGDLEVAVFSCVDARSVWVVPDDAPEPPEDLEQWLDDGSPPLPDQEDFPPSWQDYIESVEPRPGGIDPVLLWFRGPDEHAIELDFTDTWRGHHPCHEE